MKKILFLVLILCSLNVVSQAKIETSKLNSINISKKEINNNNEQIKKVVQQYEVQLKNFLEETLKNLLLYYGVNNKYTDFLFSTSFIDEIFKLNTKKINYTSKNTATVTLEIELVGDDDIFDNDIFDDNDYRKMGVKSIDMLDLSDEKVQEKLKKIFIEKIKNSKKERETNDFKFEKVNGIWQSTEIYQIFNNK